MIILGQAIAYNKNDHKILSWMTPDRPLINYWREPFNVKSPYYWKAEFNYYREMLGYLGIGVYFYERVIKLGLIFLLNLLLPITVRQQLKTVYRKYFKRQSNSV